MAIYGKNYIVLTTDGSHNDTVTSIVCNEDVPTTGFDIMIVVSSPFEIMRATAGASKTLTVVRGEEGTSGVTIPSGTTLVCELTHETLDNVYGVLLDAEKVISGNETNASMVGRTPDVNEVTIDTTNDKVYIGVDGSPNTWEELCAPAHADYDDLATSELHTQYYTEGRADTWHDAIVKEHLTAVAHAHDGTGTDGAPVARIRALAAEPADTVTGGVYYNTTSKTIYYYAGGWQQYNTVPQYAMIFREDGSCPDGWTEKSSWDGYFLKGDSTGVYAGGSGGSLTHTHLVSDVPEHAHTIPDRSVSVTAVADHTHSVTVYTAGTSTAQLKQSNYDALLYLSTTGDHSHTLTVPEHDTDSAGVVGAESQSASSLPKYVELTLCEKD